MQPPSDLTQRFFEPIESSLDAHALKRQGDSHLAAGDHVGAREYYERAIESAHGEGDAAIALYDLLIKNNNLDEAHTLLARVDRVEANPHIVARRVNLAARQGNRDAAFDRIIRLCCTTDEEWLLRCVCEDTIHAGWIADLERALCVAVLQQACRPFAGHLLVMTLLRQNREAQLEGLVDSVLTAIPGSSVHVAATPAIAAILQSVVEHLGGVSRAQSDLDITFDIAGALPKVLRTESRRLKKFIERRCDLLRSDTAVWAATGNALFTFRDYAGTVEWMADWPARKGVQGWMTLKVGEAYRAMEDDTLAAEVHARSYAVFHDSTKPLHGLWVVLDAIRDGRTYDARSVLDAIEPQLASLSKGYRFLHQIVVAAHSVSIVETRRAAFARARVLMCDAACEHPKYLMDRELQRAYHLCAGAIANGINTLGARYWQYCLRL